jgi:hypothetical protein
VTEVEWLACTALDPMVGWRSHCLSARQILLFACGCCRALHWRFADSRSWAAVEKAEQLADGATSPASLRLAAINARSAFGEAVAAMNTPSRPTHAG